MNNAMMAEFLSKNAAKGVESKAEREAENKALAKLGPPEQRDAILVKLDQANRALAEATTMQQTKTVLDVAHAAKVYAERQQLGDAAKAKAHEIIVYAEQRLGEMLLDRPKAKPGVRSKIEPNPTTPRLKDLGIDKHLSARAQKIAKLPQGEVDRLALTLPKRKPRIMSNAEPNSRVHGVCPTCRCK